MVVTEKRPKKIYGANIFIIKMTSLQDRDEVISLVDKEINRNQVIMIYINEKFFCNLRIFHRKYFFWIASDNLLYQDYKKYNILNVLDKTLKLKYLE